ncbi:MAG: crossover junction endodeoxyribonuclease RuvC [Bacteroidota bacterium]|jgi:crossover junction endodeoxyribonuclease RuvC
MTEKESRERIILGIDPGTSITGYGILQCHGRKVKLLNYGIIDLRKMGTDHPLKLKRIFERTASLITEFLPDELAIEAPFHGKNVQSMLKLGRAQGVAMAAALQKEVPIVEYAPKKVKMAITGNGNASKNQVNAMVERLLGFKFDHEHYPLDASDGIAVAVCHFLQGSTVAAATTLQKKKEKASAQKRSGGSWGSFVANNPARLKSAK